MTRMKRPQRPIRALAVVATAGLLLAGVTLPRIGRSCRILDPTGDDPADRGPCLRRSPRATPRRSSAAAHVAAGRAADNNAADASLPLPAPRTRTCRTSSAGWPTPTGGVAREVRHQLARVGEPARPALDELVRTTTNPDVRTAAQNVLREIDDNKLVGPSFITLCT